MTTMTHDALCSLIGAREDFALEQLKKNAAYVSVCKEQQKTEELVDELLGKLEKTDRIAIRRHYEGELHKTTYELRAAYLQGLQDCFTLVRFFTGNELCI